MTATSPSWARYSASKWGSSAMQGVQWVAQKLMKVIFPRVSAR